MPKAPTVARKWLPSRQSAYRQLFEKHWYRIRGIDFPGGRVAVRDGAGRAFIHREHSHHDLRVMARDAARRELRAMVDVQ
jgi:hypothetical protein